MVLRVYVEKKPGFDVEAKQLLAELRVAAGGALPGRLGLRVVNRYDVEGISEELFEACVPTVFSEPQSDTATREAPFDPADPGARVFAVEPLPGQFDQRAASAAECVQLVSQGERPEVRCAKVYVLEGRVSDEALEAVERYLVNPVESRLASLEPRETLRADYPRPADVARLEGFRNLDGEGLAALVGEMGLAMDAEDLAFCQGYFRDEGRDPTVTEIRVVDTYWSDHCRHTTFNTGLDDVHIDDPEVRAAYERYLDVRRQLRREDRPVSLMDMGTIGARWLKRTGQMKGVDESDEVNACTVKCTVDVDGEPQDWLYLFKNETHNHPTEIEPFGGAATCLGGAIRDPLSGRSYVYQAMRVTGAADPLAPVSETLPGKLPQRKIVTAAAAGYSSYGNQVGLATGQVSELYHPGYVAKRMEIGAVVGATPASHVRREEPAPGDVVILLGGRTGRDGIGGATGSSKAHDQGSLEHDGAEVQKGNPPEERKIQRLFRRGEACRLIKRCNDFGAGGVSVAVGELADGLDIDLDRVPKKYEGLDGTELAISESQERMAVAVAAEDAGRFCALAREENLEATPIARVTAEKRVRMRWRGDVVVDVSRAFLASNGAPKHARALVEKGGDFVPEWEGLTLEERMLSVVCDLNVACNKGLSERFDSTIGAGTVLMPFGGERQLTPAMAMAAKLPVDGETTTVSGMAWGFNPYLSEVNPYRGAYLAVVESVSRLVAAGFEHRRAYLSLQEYFEKLRGEPKRWGKPVASVLGALMAQLDLGVGAIGGKDSMSGSFEDLDVPPTLVSFATAVGSLGRVTSPEFKGAGHRVVLVVPQAPLGSLIPDPQGLLDAFDLVERLIGSGQALAVSTPGYGCLAEALFKMCVGNRLGFRGGAVFPEGMLFSPAYGSFAVELADGAPVPDSPEGAEVVPIGRTTEEYAFSAAGETVGLEDLEEAWMAALEPVFPFRSVDGEPCWDEAGAEDGEEGAGEAGAGEAPALSFACPSPHAYRGPAAGRPRVAIPVFPGTNCEYDTARAFRRAGAEPEVVVIRNLTPADVAESTARLAEAIRASQIVMLPGGFSGGDEPDGSAKFITAFFRAPEVTEAVRDLLQARDGLMLGVCNGFQALVKLGLVPFGDIRPMDEGCPTLTFNRIGRHQSRLVRTRVASTLSPWLSRCEVGDVHTVAVSHGEGRFVAPSGLLESLAASGQVATQYVDGDGQPGMGLAVNPNGSVWAIEGVTSPDGRVLGKMGHSERSGTGLYKNVPGDTFQPILEGGVAYFA